MVLKLFARVDRNAAGGTRVPECVGKVDRLDVVERVVLGFVEKVWADGALPATLHLHRMLLQQA